MDGANNGDSDHSLTWEDFYGSTTDLTPTLLGILNTFLDPSKQPEETNEKPKAVDKPACKRDDVKRKMEPLITSTPSKDPRLIAGGVKLPGLSSEESSPVKSNESTPKKSPAPKMSYVSRLKSFSLRRSSSSEVKDEPSEADKKQEKALNADVISKLNSEVIAKVESKSKTAGSFENLSPNVRKMISSAGESCSIPQPKKPAFSTVGRSSYRGKHSIIPLMGATSKITQSSMEVDTEIYDRPASRIQSARNGRFVPPTRSGLIGRAKDWSKTVSTFEPAVYDTPTASIYDIPKAAASMPFIDEPSTKAKVVELDNAVVDLGAKAIHVTPLPQISGSTGDLKSDDSRLNLPSVIRPLSMSSIASSTSTSSSGNQNKGGANSAYLASIESLDDHSDMDNNLTFGKNSRLTQINGSSLTVDSTDGGNGKSADANQTSPGRPSTPPRPRYCDPNLTLLQRVCTEIVDTEIVYVEDLRQVVEGYLHHWKENETFSNEQLNDLFSNIEEIYQFNRTFSHNLNECNLEAVAIARCFVNHSSGFSIYTQYCTDYPGIMAALTRLMRDADSAQPFRSRQAALEHALPLGSYLLKPVQRILKYHLLLQNLVKQHQSQDTEYALHKMTDIAHDINDMKRRHEHSVRVQEIQSLLYGWNGQDLTTFGELCAEGTFRVFGAKAMRHAFLFDKMLLLTKNKEFGMLAYKSHIMCNNLMLVESIQGQPLSFHVIPFDCPRMQVTLQARSIQHKREWTLLIKRNILENYHAVIPSHARQLVMELGQNKTDDDILAEKSSTLMSHASMRKQLGAPEYLEKRKLERERRKSFESGLRYKLKRPNQRKGQNYTENDESEKEKGNDGINCNSHYLCSHCYNGKNSDLYLCKECDEPLVFELSMDFSKDDSIREKCKDHERQYICNKNDNDPDKENKDSQKCSPNSPHDLCENCDRSTPNHLLVEKPKNVYDRLNEKASQTLNMKKTCLKCHKITENISVLDDKTSAEDPLTKCKHDTTNGASWNRKKSDADMKILELGSKESINESESGYHCKICSRGGIICKQCGISLPHINCIKCTCSKLDEDQVFSQKDEKQDQSKILEVKVYTTKTVPKKISKIKKNRAKTLRHLAVDPTAKFYTDFTNDLHISESTDSINTINAIELDDVDSNGKSSEKILKPADMDEETYKALVQKTDSFKKSELEKDKVALQTKQTEISNKVSNVSSDDKILQCNLDSTGEVEDDNFESCDDGNGEKPLEQIISQLLMQNREFQKILKRHQLRNANNRRNQRLLKSHSNPEKVFAQNVQNKNRVKYGRQLSADEPIIQVDHELSAGKEEVMKNHENITKPNEEPIYETLTEANKEDAEKKVVLQQNTDKDSTSRNSITESDYVYLCFDGKKSIDAYKVPINIANPDDADDQIYAIPSCVPLKISDDIVEARQDKSLPTNDIEGDCYENASDIWKRISKDTVIENKTYAADKDNIEVERNAQSPNIPQIWLNRQKEHFGTPREKKSGSLPRSFQVVLNDAEMKSSTKALNKMYLNKEGKVIQTDRPFTIASDHSEISYEDIERFINTNDDSGLAFPQKGKLEKGYSSFLDSENIDEIFDSVTKSALELEAEIDRCYTNRFGSKQVADSISSSMEVINDKLDCETSHEDINMSVHPEHKIYKHTNSNILSFKSVLNRFKSRKGSIERKDEADVIEEKSVQKKPSPKNLLQRLKSIKHDDENEDSKNKNTIKLPVNNNSIMSNSFCGESTKSIILDDDAVSKSCTNIAIVKPTVHTTSNSSFLYKSTKSIQDINKLPTYKQGSRLLGARIAQSDYADPKVIFSGSNTELNKVNVFVNKNAVRPDSVLSNSSHFTSSSDGCFTSNINGKIQNGKPLEINSNLPSQTDESFYEKSFEEIEQLFNSEEIFRDSAIYSDDGNNFSNDFDPKPTLSVKNVFKPIEKEKNGKIPVVNYNKSEIRNQGSIVLPKVNLIRSEQKIEALQVSEVKESIQKIAPPIPTKPLITKTVSNKWQLHKNLPINKLDEIKSIETKNKLDLKLQKSNLPMTIKVDEKMVDTNKEQSLQNAEKSKVGIPRPSYQRSTSTSITMKRMSFERCSLDSSTISRRSKSVSSYKCENGNGHSEDIVITKSVQERRKEIERLNENCLSNRKSLDSLDGAPVSLSRSFSLKATGTTQSKKTAQKCNIPVRSSDDGDIRTLDDPADPTKGGSWVKQVVNRFQ